MPAPLCFFRFPTPDVVEWLRADSAIQRGSWAELAEQTAGSRLLLIAPGEAITLHQVPLPSRKRSTWARAVPYALEDQVVEDIETLHFALASAPDGDCLPVAVVSNNNGSAEERKAPARSEITLSSSISTLFRSSSMSLRGAMTTVSPRIFQLDGFPSPESPDSTRSAAARVSSISPSPCAEPTKAASNCEGAR